MIGDIILFLKTWWKQNVTCHHKYVYKEYGNIYFEECRKCGRIKNYIGQNMDRNQAKEFYPFLQAYAEGRVIECRTKPSTVKGTSVPNDWTEMKEIEYWCNMEYRIKPEPKYYPFENAKECWNEMQKHQPFGWVKDRDGNKTFIGGINSDNSVCMCNSEILFLKDIFEDFTFIDGIPFGVKVEEQLWKLMKKQMK